MDDRPILGSVGSALAGGAVVLLAGALGAFVYPYVVPPAPPPPAPEAFPAAPPAALPAVDPQAVAHLDAAGLAQLLASRKGDPLAAEFGARFLATPELKTIWDGYQSDGDFSGMFHRLQNAPAFAPFLVRMKEDAKLRESLDAVITDPRVSALIDFAQTHEHDPAAAPLPGSSRRPAARTVINDFDTDFAGVELRQTSQTASKLLLALGALLGVVAWRVKARVAAEAGAAPAAGAPAAPARQAGPVSFDRKYETVRVLAQSESAQLLEARDRRLDRLVLVHKSASRDPEERRRLMTAPRAAAAILHPALLEIYEILEEGDSVLIVYERCHGKTAAELGASPLGAARAAQILEPACLALEAAHARGVYHRWLAPDRILVTDQGFTKVVGLGMAKDAAGDGRDADVRAMAACLRALAGGRSGPVPLEAEAVARDASIRTMAELAARLRALGAVENVS